jgi:hypothetical protein
MQMQKSIKPQKGFLKPVLQTFHATPNKNNDTAQTADPYNTTK